MGEERTETFFARISMEMGAYILAPLAILDIVAFSERIQHSVSDVFTFTLDRFRMVTLPRRYVSIGRALLAEATARRHSGFQVVL